MGFGAKPVACREMPTVRRPYRAAGYHRGGSGRANRRESPQRTRARHDSAPTGLTEGMAGSADHPNCSIVDGSPRSPSVRIGGRRRPGINGSAPRRCAYQSMVLIRPGVQDLVPSDRTRTATSSPSAAIDWPPTQTATVTSPRLPALYEADSGRRRLGQQNRMICVAFLRTQPSSLPLQVGPRLVPVRCL